MERGNQNLATKAQLAGVERLWGTSFRSLTIRLRILLPFLLVALVFLFFWPEVTGRAVFNYQYDNSLDHYPLRTALAEALRGGSLPIWVPYIYTGFPLYAQPPTGALYPLNWLLYGLLPTYLAHNYTLILIFSMTGLLTYGYARALQLGRPAAFLAALAFMGGGALVGATDHFIIVEPVVWLPLLFLFIEWLVRKGHWRYAWLGGIVMALQFLAGFPQTTFYAWIAAALYFCIRLFQTRFTIDASTDERPISDAKRHLIHLSYFMSRISRFALAVIVALLLSAVQILPTWELMARSQRASGIDQIGISLAPWEILTFLVPYAFSFVQRLSQGPQVMTYVGILPLFFALLALLDRSRSKYILPFLAILLFSLFIALGDYLPFYRLVQELPGFHLFRNPNRVLFLTGFSLAMLAGLGFELALGSLSPLQKVWAARLVKGLMIFSVFYMVAVIAGSIVLYIGQDFILTRATEYFVTHGGGTLSLAHYLRRFQAIYLWLREQVNPVSLRFGAPAYIILISMVLVVLWLRQQIKASLFRPLAIALIVVDLGIFAYAVEPARSLPVEVYLSEPDAQEFLRQDTSLYRIFSPFSWERQYDLLYASKLEELHRLRVDLIVPDLNIPVHFSTLDALLGLPLARGITIHFFLHPDAGGQAADAARLRHIADHTGFLGLLNVKYILTPDPIESPDLILRYHNRVYVYENRRSVPRAFVVPQARVIADEQAILDTISRQDFAPLKEVILEEEPVTSNLPTAFSTQQDAELVEYGDTRVVIRAAGPGFLVLTDTYYPGWQAKVDGQEVKIYRANYNFRAVALPPGNHEVVFTFEPTYLRIGAAISVATLIAVVAGLLGSIAVGQWLRLKGR